MTFFFSLYICFAVGESHDQFSLFDLIAVLT